MNEKDPARPDSSTELPSQEIHSQNDISIEEALKRGIIDKDQADYWTIYEKKLNALVNSEIPEHKWSQALKKAKKLSVNPKFQTAVEAIREQWAISPRLPPDELFGEALYPENVLSIHTSILSTDERWLRLQHDLKETLCKPFGLDWTRDYGLIVTGVCFGLTPSNLSDHWQKISITAAVDMSPGVIISLLDEENQRRQRVGMTLTIAYLAWQLLSSPEVSIESFPESIRAWISAAFESLSHEDRYLNPQAAPDIIDQAQAYPDSRSRTKPSLYLQIGPETTKTDVERIWPQVELQMLELWGAPPQRQRLWRTYARATYIKEKRETEGMTYEQAYNAWLREHPKEEPVEISAVIKSVKRLEKL